MNRRSQQNNETTLGTTRADYSPPTGANSLRNMSRETDGALGPEGGRGGRRARRKAPAV